MFLKARSFWLLTAVFILQLAATYAQDPLAVYLTWQRDPTTTMTIQWVSSLQDSEDLLYYKTLDDPHWTRIQGTHERLPQRYPYYVHRMELRGLRPETSYEFRIGNDPVSYKFRTLPQQLAEKSLRFAVGGDMYQGAHQETTLMEKTNRLVASTEPDFVLLGGDLAYSGKHFWFASEDGNRWIAWLKAWHKTMVTPSGYLIPVLTAIGNHEVNGRFDQTPTQAAFYYTLFPTPGYQAFDFGDYLTLVILDSGHTHPIKGAQTFWLEQTLKHRLTRPFKMALYHVPAYPSHGPFNFKQSVMIRKHWVPLFDQYRVDVAFEHHCHTFKRTYRIKQGQIDPKGVLYLGDGAWSVKKARTPVSPKQSPFIAKSSSSHHFLLIDFSKDTQRYRAINSDGELIDDYSEP